MRSLLSAHASELYIARTNKTDDLVIFHVTGPSWRDRDGYYSVRMVKGELLLTCNCTTGRHAQLCDHVALVKEFLAEQQERRARAMEVK